MTVKINSVHFKTDRKLDEFIEAKIDKLNKFFDALHDCEVILKVENSDDLENKTAEIRLEVPGSSLFAKKQSDSFEESVTLATEALRRQLLKRKNKLRSR
jgi:putative sigma-54 modulation protein